MKNVAFVAKKYAQAFLNVYDKHIDEENFRALLSLADFFKKNKQFILLLKIPHIENDAKKNAFKELFERFEISHVFLSLVDLLLEHRRSFLFPQVLSYICSLHKKYNNIEEFSIVSSHHLGEQYVSVLQQFLAHQTGCDIIYIQNVDPTLIAGLRMQSGSWLWEYSIDKKLRTISQALVR